MARGESLIRQWNLLKALQSHRFGVSVDELAERLECSGRQVRRDLAVLQLAGFPLDYDQRDYGKRFWKLSPMFIERQELVLSVTEMLSLFLSRQVLAPLSGTQFGDGLTSALDKIKALLPAKALRYFDSLDESLLVKPVARHDYSAHRKQIAAIQQAMSDGRVLRIRYHSASQRRVIETRFHPYGLVFFGVDLYCIGHLAEYGEIRTLKIVRFLEVEPTTDRFTRPPTFSLAEYTRGSFGIFSPGRIRTIKARFTGWAATNIREHQWHPSQKIISDSRQGASLQAAASRPGGHVAPEADAVVATFELADTAEFRRWLLGFGRHAVVLSPKDLARELAGELAAARENYGTCS